MGITVETKVAEIAASYPVTIRVFQRHGLDFCCGGKRPLAEACGEVGLDPGIVRDELQEAIEAEPMATRAWTDEPLTALVAHVIERYHVPLRAELARLAPMAAKVHAVHGPNHPEVAEVARLFRALGDDLEPHMMKEERVLFPYLERLTALADAGERLTGSPFGSVQGPVAVMEDEHEAVGALLAELRTVTGGFTPPPDACLTFRGLYLGLAELEKDLHEHIHLENNVMFPRAVALEEELRGR